MSYEAKLKELGLTLPDPPKPVANYVPVVRVGDLLFLSGVLPSRDGQLIMTGKLGGNLTIEQGIEASRVAVLNGLSIIRSAAGSLDLVTCPFGFRNLVNYRAGLAEILRVLKPSGTVAILEFSTPPNALFRRFYEFYSLRVLPRIAAMISGVPEAYEYLPESVRKFPGAPELAEAMRGVGFGDVEFTRMTFGIVALHIGRKRA